MKTGNALGFDIYDNLEECEAAMRRGEMAVAHIPRPTSVSVTTVTPPPLVIPQAIGPHAPGAKLDTGKPEAALLLDFSRAMLAVAEVSTFGANKYTRGGWQTVPDADHRYRSALLRHLLKGRTIDKDEESGLLHDAHMAWNAMALLELRLRNL